MKLQISKFKEYGLEKLVIKYKLIIWKIVKIDLHKDWDSNSYIELHKMVDMIHKQIDLKINFNLKLFKKVCIKIICCKDMV